MAALSGHDGVGQASHRCPMAPPGLPPVLALALAIRTAVSGSRDAQADPRDEQRQPDLGSTPNPRRIAQARHRDQPSDSCQVYGAKTRDPFRDLAQLSAQSGGGYRRDRHVRRGVRFVPAAVCDDHSDPRSQEDCGNTPLQDRVGVERCPMESPSTNRLRAWCG
jgi:hypothetical protein